MSTMPNPQPAGEMRASDAEREQVAARLREAAAEGRLTLAEVDERQRAAYAARSRDDLARLTEDLPESESRTSRPARGMSSAGRRRFAVHAAIVAALAVALILRWTAEPTTWFWPAWPLLWMSLSLMAHYRWRRRRDRGGGYSGRWHGSSTLG